MPGSKYCVILQWPLPRYLVKTINAFFHGHLKTGHVRESLSPHSSPTFCVKKATGGWRIMHKFNKLNDFALPAQTPIPRMGIMLYSMSGSVIFSAIDLTDGFCQVLMRSSDISLTAVSTPEWFAIDVTGNTTCIEECTGYFQSHVVSGAETTSEIRAQLLR